MKQVSPIGLFLCAMAASVWACSGKVGKTDNTGGSGPGEGGSSQGEGGSSQGEGGAGPTDANTGGVMVNADKLDLLLMIDNSLGMGDKQTVLSLAVPQLLQRLTNPDCVSADGTNRESASDPTATCSANMTREFAPLKDIHIGVVTSSLGDFGGDVCPETPAESAYSGFPDQNDHGWLLGALPRVAGTVSGEFLTWSKEDAAAYVAKSGTKVQEFRDFVTATGEVGCGFEMSLESWYRFLIDPKPPVDVALVNAGYSVRNGVDQSILAQRARFLRSDSLVAVVMLTDENDCSLRDSHSYSWVPATSANNFRMWRASNACAANPNDECCFSCMMVGVDSTIPQRCLAAEPTCTQATSEKLTLENDQTGLRCKDMKRRFGFDFLFPITRYANALTMPEICPEQTYGDLDCSCSAAKAKGVACVAGDRVVNPLFANLNPSVTPTGPDRQNASAVFFAGIVGVPWQDLANASALGGGEALSYKPASALNWALFAPIDDVTAPLDPFMIESTSPRTGVHPITGDVLAPPDSARDANNINGHEWLTDNVNLQYVCTFSLEQKITEGTADATRSCADVTTYCAGAPDLVKCTRQFVGCGCGQAADPSAYTQNSPICQQADGSYSSKQVKAKAHPSIRELQALRSFHEKTGNSDNAIVASVCPKDMTFVNQKTPGYGYTPAVTALVDQLRLHLKP